MRKGKRVAAFLASFVICMGMMNSVAFAEADDTYQYVYNNNEHWSISPHLTSVKYSDGSRETMFPDLFLLDTAGEEVADAETDSAAYCCDIRTGIETEKLYRRVNLEDSTYFDDVTAARIRGIVTNGYWNDWEDEDVANTEAAVNQWLAEEGKDGAVSGLTRAEALTATQAAIWHVVENMEDNEDIASFLPYAQTVYMSHWDPNELVIDPRVDIHEAASENTKANIEWFYGYLLQRTAKAADTVLFTGEHFAADQAVVQKGDSMTLRFRLKGTVGEQDDLKLTALLGERSPLEYLLTGDGKIEPDSDGYYTITFDDVTEEEWKSAIRMAVFGNQMMDGVCFYQAKPADGSGARETSQNLIGKISALTAVYAEAVLELSEIPTEVIPADGESTELPEPEKEASPGGSEEKATIGTTADSTGRTAAVQTGDETDLTLWIIAACGAAMTALAVMLTQRAGRRKKEKTE